MSDDDTDTDTDDTETSSESEYHLGMCPEVCSAIIAEGQACGEHCQHYIHLTGDHHCQGGISHTF